MKVLWFAPYPVSKLMPLPVEHEPFSREHHASWTVNLSEAMVQFHPEIELHIAVMSEAVKKSFSLQKDGITFHVVKSQYKLPFGKHWPPFEWNVFTKYSKFRSRLCEVAKEVKPDIIHAFGTEFVYALAAKDSGMPYLIYVQGIVHKLAEIRPGDKKYAIRLSLEREALDHCRHYVAETAFGEDFIHEATTGSTVWRLANSVAEPYFKVVKNGKINNKLLFVGSVIQAKGVQELLSAVEQNDWQLTLVGDNSGAYAQGLMEQFSHNSRIIWAGRIPTDEVTRLMAEHDAYVLPSHMDTSPYTVAEAMAAGLPVVASRVGGIPDMVEDGVTGILIEPKNIESLAGGIKQLYADPESMMAMGVAGKKIALERYTPQSNARILVDAYRKVCGKAKEGQHE